MKVINVICIYLGVLIYQAPVMMGAASDCWNPDRLAKMKERQAEYKKLRNEIVAKLRKLEKDYFRKKIMDSIGNIKNTGQ